MTDKLDAFRREVHDWLDANCPESMRRDATLTDLVYGGKKAEYDNPEAKLWLDRMAERGWTVPTWPTEYGGGGLSMEEAKVLKEEMARLNCRPPLIGHGVWMLGPALLEFGNEEQKQRHLPPIARGEIRWCQGYSEPGAGSDLASLRTKCEDKGDHFLVNGAKTWTTDAHKADWIFCLVRTNFDPEVKKQAGISFLLIDMETPGVEPKPITLISGDADFCDTFFDNVEVPKENLVGELNQGWTIAKGLLVHERTMMADLQAFMPRPKYSPVELAKKYIGVDGDGRLHDPLIRDRLAWQAMRRRALALTQQRIMDEFKAGMPSAASLMMKVAGTELDQAEAQLRLDILGHQGLGWDGEGFEDHELRDTRQWLMSKGITLGGGTSEIQRNVIAKHALQLPTE